MRYCPDCGTGHECETETEAGRSSDAVRIAEIKRDEAIALARINRGVVRELAAADLEAAEIVADAEVESAVAEAEVVGAAIEAGAVPPPEPIVIDAPVINDDDQADDAPPPAEGSVPPEPKRKASGLGMW